MSAALEQRPIGASGTSVSALGLGTAALAVPYGAPGAERPAPPRDVAAAAIATALAAGVNLIDTAPAYGDAEAIVGEAAGDARCLIATKLAIPSAGWLALGDGIEAAVRASAEASLAALRREQIDLLQIHNADAALLADGRLLAALGRLRDEGLVGLLGATVYGEEHALAAIRADGIDVVQVAHNALDRRAERAVMPLAAERGVAVMTRSALLRGVLSPAGARLTGPFAPLGAAADAFRGAIGASWDELPGAAVAWAAGRPGIACTILGPRDAAELSDLLTGAERFAGAAAAAGAAWHRDLPDDLLDPSRWPAEGAA